MGIPRFHYKGQNEDRMALTAPGYTGTAKSLHWLILALLIAQFIFAWTMPHIGRNTPVTTLISLHFTFGIIILAVAIVRLAWRVTHGEPAPEDGLPPWQNLTARIVHYLLYALLFVIPLLGWMDASRRGMPVEMFGLELPKLLATGKPGWNWTGDVHGLLANYAMLALVGLHAVAALYHHFVRHDGVLKRMLPGR
jgi:cytochrome b561